MPSLVRQLPFSDEFTTLVVQGTVYRIFPRQIIVWLSVGRKGVRDLDPRMPRFPAVLDTGFTDNFIMHEQQLRRFAGLEPQHLQRLNDSLRAHGRPIPLHAANLWIQSNRTGERDQVVGVPFLLELHRGIGLTTDSDLYPRLPLLGGRAFRQNKLQVHLDFRKCRVSIRTPRRFWLFG
jgi:hypothetical protein